MNSETSPDAAAEVHAFTERFATEGQSPDGTARLLVEALLVAERDEPLAEQLMTVVLSKRHLTPAPDTPSGFRLPPSDQSLRRLRKNPDIARSLAGGTHARDYADFDPTRIDLDRVYSARAQGVDYPRPGEAKLFVRCGGADTPRPITFARNNAGLWKVTGFSSLTVGVRPRASVAGDF